MSSQDSNRSTWIVKPLWRRAWFEIICLVMALGSYVLAYGVLVAADDTPLTDWPLGPATPAVCLSLLVTLSNACLRVAFRDSADMYWWSLLVSRDGTALPSLHQVWELRDNSFAFACSWKGSKALLPAMRTAGLFILLTAATGPLLQRAITVDVQPFTSEYNATLPIRREPMWDLTTTRSAAGGGWVWARPPYLQDFAHVVSDFNSQRPLELSSPACPVNATCKANITIATFSRACDTESTQVQGAPILENEQVIATNPSNVYRCANMGDKASSDEDDASSCNHFFLEYQLGLHLNLFGDSSPTSGDGPKQINESDIRESEHRGPKELPWQKPDWPPESFNYTSFFRKDSKEDVLTIRRCNFSTAFVDIAVEITDRTVVRIDGSVPLQYVESIPIPYQCDTYSTMGFQQAMSDLYGGFAMFDNNEFSLMIRGLGPRQFLHQTVGRVGTSTLEDDPDPSISGRDSYTYSDPLEDFTQRLHELSLRYALRARIEEEQDKTAQLSDECAAKGKTTIGDRRADAREVLKTAMGPNQQVSVQESRAVPTYRTQYGYAHAVLAISVATALPIIFLLAQCGGLGRSFSMAPLELAKAFDAPLLRDIGGSNATKEQITAELRRGDVVRYGEQARGVKTQNMAQDGGEEGNNGDVSLSLIGERRPRLVIDLAEGVTAPVNGKVYD